MKNISMVLVLVSIILGAYSQQCPLNCNTCTTTTSCSRCNAGFFLVNNTFCPPCPTGCTSCSLVGNATMPTCTACASPAQLSSNGTCFICDPSCLVCSVRPNNCTSCKDGLVLNQTTIQINNVSTLLGLCQSNPNCTIPSCAYCTKDAQNNTICSRCLPGYFVFKTRCYPCKFSCSVCSLEFPIIWTANVSSFWDRSIRAALNITTNVPPTGSVPPYMNNLYWNNMTMEIQRNWVEAFYIYRAMEPILVSLNITLNRVITEGITFVNSILNMTMVDQQKAILTKINEITQKNFTWQLLE